MYMYIYVDGFGKRQWKLLLRVWGLGFRGLGFTVSSLREDRGCRIEDCMQDWPDTYKI